jgi:hypothetical protein
VKNKDEHPAGQRFVFLCRFLRQFFLPSIILPSIPCGSTHRTFLDIRVTQPISRFNPIARLRAENIFSPSAEPDPEVLPENERPESQVSELKASETKVAEFEKQELPEPLSDPYSASIFRAESSAHSWNPRS